MHETVIAADRSNAAINNVDLTTNYLDNLNIYVAYAEKNAAEADNNSAAAKQYAANTTDNPESYYNIAIEKKRLVDEVAEKFKTLNTNFKNYSITINDAITIVTDSNTKAKNATNQINNIIDIINSDNRDYSILPLAETSLNNANVNVKITEQNITTLNNIDLRNINKKLVEASTRINNAVETAKNAARDTYEIYQNYITTLEKGL